MTDKLSDKLIKDSIKNISHRKALEIDMLKSNQSREELDKSSSEDLLQNNKKINQVAEDADKNKYPNKGLGYFIIVVSCLLVSILNQLQKTNQEMNNATGPELIFYQYFILMPVFYWNMRRHGRSVMDLQPENRVLMFYRAIFGQLMDILLALSFQFISFSKAMCLCFLNPLWIPLFARCITKEKLRYTDIVALVISCVGMVLIIQPYKEQEAN